MTQLALARSLRWLRRAFPPEVIGIVVILLGLSLVPGALERCLEEDGRGEAGIGPMVAGVTLAIIVGTAIYGRGPWRLFSLMIGTGAGIGLSIAFGLFSPGDLRRLADTPVFALPRIAFDGWIFNWNLLPLVLLIACVHTLDAMGAHVSAQKLADADWQRTDTATAERAIRAVGGGNILAGLLGGYPAGLSSSSVGLSFTSGAVAWRIGVLTGLLGMACAFIPKIAMFWRSCPSRWWGPSS